MSQTNDPRPQVQFADAAGVAPATKREEQILATEAPEVHVVDGVEFTSEQWKQIQEDFARDEKAGIKIIDTTKNADDSDEPVTHYSFTVAVRTPKRHHIYRGRMLFGVFEAKITTMKDGLAIARMKAFLRGGQKADAFEAYENMLIDQQAVLSIALTKKPDWFDLEETTLEDVVAEVYDYVFKQEAFFRGA